MLSPLLDALTFRSNNAVHRPVIDALEFLKARRESRQRYFTLEEGVPIDGVVRSGWKEIVLEKDKHGAERINRINYEIAVLQALRERLRCKEIWVVGADRYRNPDEDLPSDFEAKREPILRGPRATPGRRAFVAGLQTVDDASPSICSRRDLPRNRKVRIIERRKGAHLGLPHGSAARAGQPLGVEGGDYPPLADDQPARRAQGDRPARRFHRRIPESGASGGHRQEGVAEAAAPVPVRPGDQHGAQAGLCERHRTSATRTCST